MYPLVTLITTILLICLLIYTARLAYLRYRWMPTISIFYAVTVFGVYLGLCVLLRGQGVLFEVVLPFSVALIGIVVPMALGAQFWREYSHVQAQLLQAEKMASLGQLVAGIAHELNTPLGAIKSSQDTFARSIIRIREETAADDDRLVRALAAMEEAAAAGHLACDRVDELVTRMRSFVALDEAVYQRVDINENIRTTLRMMASHIPSRIAVRQMLAELPEVGCYPDRMNQVFVNILMNSVEAIEGDGEIEVNTKLEAEKVVVELNDSGRGIAAADLPKVFDPGFTNKGVKVGAGMGLAICYQTVMEQGGAIDIASSEAGTTVRITMDTDWSPEP